MALFSSSQPSLRARILPRFPAQVRAGTGMTITKSGGVYTFNASSSGRERLVADRNYYVATTGSNANDGLTIGSPFATIQYAVDLIKNDVDPGGYSIGINIADGTYSESIKIDSILSGTLVLLGNTVSPGNVIVQSDDANPAIWIANQSAYTVVQGIKVIGGTSDGILVDAGAATVEMDNIIFGAAHFQLWVFGNSLAYIFGDYEVAGDAVSHIVITSAFFSHPGGTTTVNGNFSTFIDVSECGVCEYPGAIFAGVATGKRFDVTFNGVISTFSGANPNYFPGTIAGTTSTGGQFQ